MQGHAAHIVKCTSLICVFWYGAVSSIEENSPSSPLTFIKCDLHDDAVFWTGALAAISLIKP